MTIKLSNLVLVGRRHPLAAAGPMRCSGFRAIRRQLRDAPAKSDRQVVQAPEVSQPTVSETRKCSWESVDAIEVITFTDPPGRE